MPRQVFLSYAGDDRATAHRISAELARHHLEARVDFRDIPAGGNIVLAINDALSGSDYCLLLWSRHAENRAWVTSEWTAAFHREVAERRSFLFVARLDDTPVPVLLAPRRSLDLFRDFDAELGELVQTWRRDERLGARVLPAPVALTPGPGGPPDPDRRTGLVEIYVRNQALAISVVTDQSAENSGAGVWAGVRKALDLHDQVSLFAGAAGMRFTYALWLDGAPVPDDAGAPVVLSPGDVLDLVIDAHLTSRAEPLQSWRWRAPGDAAGAPSGMAPAVVQALVDAAFGHLQP